MPGKVLFAAMMLVDAGAAGAVPPPVPVAPVVVAEDSATAEKIRDLIADMARGGHFDAAPPGEAPDASNCAQVGVVMRATCYATAARLTRNPNLVFVFAEPGNGPLRVECVGSDQNRAQSVDLDLAVAIGANTASARPPRQALASCMIGALNSPPVPRPPGGERGGLT